MTLYVNLTVIFLKNMQEKYFGNFVKILTAIICGVPRKISEILSKSREMIRNYEYYFTKIRSKI